MGGELVIGSEVIPVGLVTMVFEKVLVSGSEVESVFRVSLKMKTEKFKKFKRTV